ncbi:TetR/AcrR family transcriptional regulator [Paraburkholderia acidipaludis]|uniref:TetR/AcrR family transcriptional regulator n=1 Tax=Paraburkholderia acidipaludis TaxID=660537 RepID=UPI000484BC60|nr:TetR/AcrR family transcriptional regulator [Paraburkholderia acidipaludis]
MSTVESSGETNQRERILKVAAQLFAERGYHAIGMTELGDAVQLGRGALYHHIKSKEDLLYDISREYISDLADFAERVARPESDPRKRITMLGRQLVLKIASHQAELTVCFREIQSLTEPRHSEVLALHGKYEKVWRDAMIDGAELGLFRPYDPIVLKGVLGMYFYSYLWMRTDGRLTPAHIGERLNELALRMLDIRSPEDIAP